MASTKVAVGVGLGVVAVAGFLLTRKPKAVPRANLRQRKVDLVVKQWHEALAAAAHVLGVATPPTEPSRETPVAATNGQTVFYNTEFLLWISDRYCGEQECSWSILTGIAAHELGHIVARDPARRLGLWEDPRAAELRADRLAGRVLRKLGINSKHFAQMFEYLFPNGGSTHPPGLARQNEVLLGYWELA